MNLEKGISMDDPLVLTNEDLHRLHRHFINFMCNDEGPAALIQSGGRSMVYNFSAFVVEIKGLWVAITAGHVFAELKEAVLNGSILTNWRIDDSMIHNHRQPSYPIPLDLEKDVIFFDVAGMDYGAYVLNEMTKLAISDKDIFPIKERNWDANDFENFSFWTLLGTPFELTELQPNGSVIKNHVTAHLIPLFDRPDVIQETKYQRLYAKIDFESVEGLSENFDLGGVSGGPIFGTMGPPRGNNYEYRLIGIQSTWDEKENLAFCAAQPFLRTLSSLIN